MQNEVNGEVRDLWVGWRGKCVKHLYGVAQPAALLLNIHIKPYVVPQ